MRQMRCRFRKLKVGIIGDGTHSKRIQKILNELNIIYIVYKPSKLKKYCSLADLKLCDAIFIVSPNQTHIKYIKKFYKSHYIFCEKPPVNTKKDVKFLSKLNHKKIYFNYNFRYSKLANIISDVKKFNFGNFLYANIITSHNLAQKKNYLNSWRSNKKLCPKGVYEIVAIHWIDFVNYYFNTNKIISLKIDNTSKIGNSFDTSHISISSNKNEVINIFTSYNSPYCNKSIFIYENGLIENNEKFIGVYGPANNQDKQGFTVAPKIIKKFTLNEETDYYNSMRISIKNFIYTVKEKNFFPKSDFIKSLKSNSMLFLSKV